MFMFGVCMVGQCCVQSDDVIGEEMGFGVVDDCGDGLCFVGDFCLVVQRFELVMDFIGQVVEMCEVCFYGVEFVEGFFFVVMVFQDFGCFFDEFVVVFW